MNEPWSHGIIENLKLEKIHKDCPVQSLAPHRTTQTLFGAPVLPECATALGAMLTTLWGRAFSLHCSKKLWHESFPNWSKLLQPQQYPHKSDFIFCGLVAILLNGGNVSHDLQVTHFPAQMFQRQTMKRH